MFLNLNWLWLIQHDHYYNHEIIINKNVSVATHLSHTTNNQYLMSVMCDSHINAPILLFAWNDVFCQLAHRYLLHCVLFFFNFICNQVMGIILRSNIMTLSVAVSTDWCLTAANASLYQCKPVTSTSVRCQWSQSHQYYCRVPLTNLDLQVSKNHQWRGQGNITFEKNVGSINPIFNLWSHNY